MQLVDQASGLSMALARLRPPNEIPVHVQLVNFPVAIAAEQKLVRRR